MMAMRLTNTGEGYWLVLICTVLVVVIATPATGAESNPDEEVMVVTATRSQSRLAQTPGSIEVVDAASLKEMNARTLADALEYATGMVVSGETGRVRAPSIRGTSAEHALVLIDGRRLVPGYGELVDINQIPLTLVERVEIVRGPASALYGSDALGGVVNVITRQPGSGHLVQAEGMLGANAEGEGEAWLGSAAVSTGKGPLSLLAGGEWRSKNIWNVEEDDGSDDGDDIELASGGARFRLDLPAGQFLEGGYDYSDHTREGDRLIEKVVRLRDVDAENESGYLRYNAMLPGGDQVQVLLNRSEYRENLGLSPPAGSAMEGSHENTLNQIEWQYTGTFFERHMLTLGGEWREEEREGSQIDDLEVENLSFYLQDEFFLWEKFQFVLGLRYDDHETFGEQWSPRLSVVYHFNERWRLKASYGEGFRAPNLSELYVTTWRKKGKWIYQPNEDLDAETSRSAELRLEGQSGGMRSSLTLFYTEVDDLIESEFVETRGSGKHRKDYYRFQNIGEARMQGVEWDASARLGHGFTFSAQATWQDCENRDTGDDLEGQPDLNANAKLAYDHADWGVHANVRVQYLGDVAYATADGGDYTLTHLYCSKRFGENMEGFAGVDNLFNKTEADSAVATYIEPRFFYAGVRLNF
jgi:outer membrane receptor for ferrienterochelin and colicins